MRPKERPCCLLVWKCWSLFVTAENSGRLQSSSRFEGSSSQLGLTTVISSCSPTRSPLTSSNQTAWSGCCSIQAISALVQMAWNGMARSWSLVNQLHPFTESEVGANGRFESDFMSKYIGKLKLSKEAKAVLDEGRKVWKEYHSIKFEKKIRDEFKLNRPDVGWYQIRRALETNGSVGLCRFQREHTRP